MHKLIAALALACALTFAGTAAAVDFGANDDTGKYARDGGAAFFSQMAAARLKQNVITVRWTPGSREIPDRELLERVVPAAVEAGIRPVFAVYPYPPRAIETGRSGPSGFADWLEGVARAFPQVKTYIVGNEPNLNTFWRPQGNRKGAIRSGASFGPFLAAGYDALKAVSREITVLGVGLSPRGNRAPGRAGKSSPMHFISSLGAWYRKSHRRAPLMDGFSFHPYPSPSNFKVLFGFTYSWPNAGLHELHRVKQALWDAFAGTRQPTTAGGLKLYLDEVGWQVGVSRWRGYEGAENVRVTTEKAQAVIYGQLVRFVVCDPAVAELNFFGYYDDDALGGWQSALRRVDGTARPAHKAVASAIAATGGRCRGKLRRWTPLRRPDRATVTFGEFKGVQAGSSRRFWFKARAAEDVVVRAGLVPARTPLARIQTFLRPAGIVDAYRRPPLQVSARPGSGRQVLVVSVAAKLNPRRVSIFRSPAFLVTSAQPKRTDP
ncbi:MAG TPA: hypothetical protein VNP89_00645 [Gaiellaceae bacterium]|nr:hypothetical protein [Gaiellaceae bacterium]